MMYPMTTATTFPGTPLFHLSHVLEDCEQCSRYTTLVSSEVNWRDLPAQTQQVRSYSTVGIQMTTRT